MFYNTQRYHYDVIWSDEDQEYVGLCTEFPSLSWLDASSDAALQGIQQLILACVNDLQDQGEPVPEPLSVCSLPQEKRFIVRLSQPDYPTDQPWQTVSPLLSKSQSVSKTP